MSSITLARWSLMFGLAFVFLYFGIDKLLHPLLWIGWIPGWMDGLLGMGKAPWLQIIGVAEIVIAVGIVVPVRIVQQIAVIGAAVQLVAILIVGGWNDIAVRDTGLLCMATALFYLL